MSWIVIFFVLLFSFASAISKSAPVKFLVVNGTDAQSAEAPFIVSLRQRGKHICGGSLITKSIIITADHCVYENGRQERFLSVVAGITRQRFACIFGQKRFIQIIVPYDKNFYEDDRLKFDIALLKTRSPFRLNNRVKTIKWSRQVNYEQKVTVYGWGETEKYQIAKKLQKKELNLIPRDKCQKLLPKTKKMLLKEHEICTDQNTCFGDSGGPLIQKVNGEPMLVGIISWLIDNCYDPPSVSVFPGYFDAWLKAQMKQLK